MIDVNNELLEVSREYYGKIYETQNEKEALSLAMSSLMADPSLMTLEKVEEFVTSSNELGPILNKSYEHISKIKSDPSYLKNLFESSFVSKISSSTNSITPTAEKIKSEAITEGPSERPCLANDKRGVATG
jgi:hypothetical protein